MVDILERARTARRESRRVAFRSNPEARSLVRDIAAMANSGGGAIVIREGEVHINELLETLRQSGSQFGGLRSQDNLILIGEAITPIVIDGLVYVRRGAKSVPATTEDLASLIDRRVNMVRKAWLSAVRHVVQPAPPSAETARVRVVEDPRAPAFRLVDYDKTHPFRQKEVLAAVRKRLPNVQINQFDLLSIRKVHDIDSKPEFTHKPAFGSNQYSVKFLDWLERQVEGDPEFIARAKQQYLRVRRAR